MPSQTDSTGLIIHNSVINLEPIRLEYSPFADDLSSFINNFKQGWYSDQPYISIDGITAEEAIALFIAYMNTTDFLNFIRRYIRSDVFGLDAQETFEKYLKFDREFKVIDKPKLIQLLADPSSINTILTSDEIQILKEQALFRHLINNINDPLNGTSLTEAIKYNLYFYEKAVSYYSLYQNGVVDKIKEYIGANPTIDEAAIILLIQKELEKKLQSHSFISYDTIQQVLLDPLNVGTILNKDQMNSVLYRAATSLAFVTYDKVLAVEQLYDTNKTDLIKDIFNSNEIKLIMENEINEKSVIANMLTFEQVTAFFNDLKTQFLNSGLFETINITIDDINTWISEI